jgi:hypothetical protein
LIHLSFLSQFLPSPPPQKNTKKKQTKDGKSSYGRQRLWGAVGWGAFSFVSGTAISRFGSDAAFLLHAVLALATLAPTCALPFGPLGARLDKGTHRTEVAAVKVSTDDVGSSFEGNNDNDNDDDDGLFVLAGAERRNGGSRLHGEPAGKGGSMGNVDFWHGVGRLLRNPAVPPFLATATVLGFGMGVIENYLFLYLDHLGGSEALMGLSLTVTCAAEAAVFFYASKIVAVAGVQRCFDLVFLAFLVRLGCYATLAWWGSPWLVSSPAFFLC